MSLKRLTKIIKAFTEIEFNVKMGNETLPLCQKRENQAEGNSLSPMFHCSWPEQFVGNYNA